MVVRLKLRIATRDGVKIEKALVNSGYESDSPQLMVPDTIARELGLWPPPSYAREYVFDTAGGPVKVWYIPRSAAVAVLVDDKISKEVVVDIVVSPYIDEPLISDMLASELELVLLDIGRGYWKFRWEPSEVFHADP